jgi:fructokinase
MNSSSKEKNSLHMSPFVMGSGLVVLDIILDNGSRIPIFNAGGTCGNVLAGLSFLGWKSKSISRAGTDFASGILIQDLIESGVNINYVTREEKLNTPRIIEKVNSDGSYARHTFFLRCPACSRYLPRFRSPRLDIIDNILKENEKPDVFFFDRVTPSTLRLAKEYKKNGALIFFEPHNLKHLEGFRDAIEICHILKFSTNNSFSTDIKNLVKDTTLLEKIKTFKPSLVIRTLGKEGLLYSNFEDTKWHYQKGKKLKKVYDTCGAGDWLTIGFLYYLQKKAVKNHKDLIEVLESIDAVKEALDFSQVLAALSSMYVGARGISGLIERDYILDILEACTKENCEVISPIKLLSPNTKQRKYNNEKRVDSHYCPTCLLQK